MNRYNIRAEVEPLQHLGFYRINYQPDIFAGRKDVGCIGGKLLNKKGRLIGGAYTKDGDVMYKNLPEGYSGGLQHRAVLQQDCYAVDIRCIAVRPDLIDAFERVTGIKYVNTFDNASGHSQDGSSAPDERFSGLSEE